LVEREVLDDCETQRNKSNGLRVVLTEIDVVSKDGNRVSVVLKNAK